MLARNRGGFAGAPTRETLRWRVGTAQERIAASRAPSTTTSRRGGRLVVSRGTCNSSGSRARGATSARGLVDARTVRRGSSFHVERGVRSPAGVERRARRGTGESRAAGCRGVPERCRGRRCTESARRARSACGGDAELCAVARCRGTGRTVRRRRSPRAGEAPPVPRSGSGRRTESAEAPVRGAVSEPPASWRPGSAWARERGFTWNGEILAVRNGRLLIGTAATLRDSGLAHTPRCGVPSGVMPNARTETAASRLRSRAPRGATAVRRPGPLPHHGVGARTLPCACPRARRPEPRREIRRAGVRRTRPPRGRGAGSCGGSAPEGTHGGDRSGPGAAAHGRPTAGHRRVVSRETSSRGPAPVGRRDVHPVTVERRSGRPRVPGWRCRAESLGWVQTAEESA